MQAGDAFSEKLGDSGLFRILSLVSGLDEGLWVRGYKVPSAKLTWKSV